MKSILQSKFIFFMKKRCFSSLIIKNKPILSRPPLLNKNVLQKRNIIFKMNNEVPNRIVGFYVL